MKIAEGDIVSFLDDEGGGKVIKILGGGIALVLTKEGVEIKYPYSKLVRVKPDEPLNKATPFVFKDDGAPKKKLIKAKNKEAEEVDLHIEELLENYKGMENAEIIRIQLSVFNKTLDNAILSKKRKIIFIHGVGNGRLKSEIRKILAGYDRVTFYDASYKKYGWGATEVLIH